MPFSITQSQSIHTRRQLADLCNDKGIHLAVEVGTDHGIFAAQFLERWKGVFLYCVDDYSPYPNFGIDRTPDLMFAVAHLSRFIGRVRILKMESCEAANYLRTENPIGFVYIDASHEQDDVASDIAAWWPMVKSGGILAGHDFDEEHSGVMAAVKSFAEINGLAVQLTSDADSPPSWFIEKR